MANTLLSKESDIVAWLKRYKIKTYELKSDPVYGFIVNAEQDVTIKLKGKDLAQKKLVKFNQIIGDFTCAHNSLDSLDFAPSIVSGNFNAQFNDIQNFTGSTLSIVRGVCNLSCNKIDSLIGSPQTVSSLIINHNNISSWAGISQKIDKKLNISKNPIDSLEGMPSIVGEYFNCSSTNIINLEHFPKDFLGELVCERNEKLTSLKGIGDTIYKSLYLNGNSSLTSFEFGPKRVCGNLVAEDNSFTSLLYFPKVEKELLIRYNAGLGKYQDIRSYEELKEIIDVFNEQHALEKSISASIDAIHAKVVKV